MRNLTGGSVNIDVAVVSQYVTLLFIGVISVNSLRAFLKNLLKASTSVLLLAPSPLPFWNSPCTWSSRCPHPI
jgi:hypothetical protein